MGLDNRLLAEQAVTRTHTHTHTLTLKANNPHTHSTNVTTWPLLLSKGQCVCLPLCVCVCMCVYVRGGRVGDLGSGCCVWGLVATGTGGKRQDWCIGWRMLFPLSLLLYVSLSLSLALCPLYTHTTKATRKEIGAGIMHLCVYGCVCVCVVFAQWSPDRG